MPLRERRDERERVREIIEWKTFFAISPFLFFAISWRAGAVSAVRCCASDTARHTCAARRARRSARRTMASSSSPPSASSNSSRTSACAPNATNATSARRRPTSHARSVPFLRVTRALCLSASLSCSLSSSVEPLARRQRRNSTTSRE